MEQITLDMIPNSHTPTAHISQYDSGRHIRFNLKNITLTGSETVTLKIRKTDGELVSKTIENHTSYVEYVSDKADCDVSGKANCEIVISKDDVVIGSKNFIMKVEADAYDGAGVVTKTASGRIATFETNLADELQSLKCEIVATGGNGTPENPIPIVGHSELNLTRCGINLWDEEYIISSSRIRSKNVIPVAPNKTYRYINGAGIYASIDVVNANGGYISFIGNIQAGNTFTTPADCHYLAFTVATAYGTTYNNDISINYPATDMEYHAYNGTHFTVAFGQTVYGGVYDKSGRLTITHGYCQVLSTDIVGEYLDTENGQYLARLTSSNPPKRTGSASIAGDVISNILTNKDQGSLYRETGNSVCIMGDADRFRLTFENCDTFEKMQTFLTNNVTTLCYELATPIVIDVPSISVFAENGTNNVYSDTGDTEVKYLYKA